jgi:hypothetical protein
VTMFQNTPSVAAGACGTNPKKSLTIFPGEPTGSPPVSVLLTKGMIARGRRVLWVGHAISRCSAVYGEVIPDQPSRTATRSRSCIGSMGDPHGTHQREHGRPMARPFPTSPAARQLRSRSCIGSIGDPPGELCCRAGEQGDECSTGKVAYGEDHSRPDDAQYCGWRRARPRGGKGGDGRLCRDPFPIRRS